MKRNQKCPMNVTHSKYIRRPHQAVEGLCTPKPMAGSLRSSVAEGGYSSGENGTNISVQNVQETVGCLI